MDAVQAVLIISIIALTIVFVVIGVWIILFLKEIRSVVRRINQTIEEISSFTAKLNEPGTVFSGILEGIKSGVEAVALIKSFIDKNDKKRPRD